MGQSTGATSPHERAIRIPQRPHRARRIALAQNRRVLPCKHLGVAVRLRRTERGDPGELLESGAVLAELREGFAERTSAFARGQPIGDCLGALGCFAQCVDGLRAYVERDSVDDADLFDEFGGGREVVSSLIFGSSRRIALSLAPITASVASRPPPARRHHGRWGSPNAEGRSVGGSGAAGGSHPDGSSWVPCLLISYRG